MTFVRMQKYILLKIGTHQSMNPNVWMYVYIVLVSHCTPYLFHGFCHTIPILNGLDPSFFGQSFLARHPHANQHNLMMVEGPLSSYVAQPSVISTCCHQGMVGQCGMPRLAAPFPMAPAQILENPRHLLIIFLEVHKTALCFFFKSSLYWFSEYYLIPHVSCICYCCMDSRHMLLMFYPKMHGFYTNIDP